jgi:hypothetical protein
MSLHLVRICCSRQGLRHAHMFKGPPIRNVLFDLAELFTLCRQYFRETLPNWLKFGRSLGLTLLYQCNPLTYHFSAFIIIVIEYIPIPLRHPRPSSTPTFWTQKSIWEKVLVRLNLGKCMDRYAKGKGFCGLEQRGYLALMLCIYCPCLAGFLAEWEWDEDERTYVQYICTYVCTCSRLRIAFSSKVVAMATDGSTAGLWSESGESREREISHLGWKDQTLGCDFGESMDGEGSPESRILAHYCIYLYYWLAPGPGPIFIMDGDEMTFPMYLYLILPHNIVWLTMNKYL